MLAAESEILLTVTLNYSIQKHREQRTPYIYIYIYIYSPQLHLRVSKYVNRNTKYVSVSITNSIPTVTLVTNVETVISLGLSLL